LELQETYWKLGGKQEEGMSSVAAK
jgi:hypothetical protein